MPYQQICPDPFWSRASAADRGIKNNCAAIELFLFEATPSRITSKASNPHQNREAIPHPLSPLRDTREIVFVGSSRSHTHPLSPLRETREIVFVGSSPSHSHPLSPLRDTREIVFVGLFVGLFRSHSPIHWFIAKPFPSAESPSGDSRNCVRWIVRWIVPKPFAHSLVYCEAIPIR